jgi:IS1 family transposase
VNGLETVLASVLAALFTAGLPAFFTYRTARTAQEKTNQLERSKVDAAAFDRAKVIYDSTIDEVQQRCTRTEAENETLRERVAVLRRNETKLYARNAVLARAIVDLGGTLPPWENGLE